MHTWYISSASDAQINSEPIKTKTTKGNGKQKHKDSSARVPQQVRNLSHVNLRVKNVSLDSLIPEDQEHTLISLKSHRILPK